MVSIAAFQAVDPGSIPGRRSNRFLFGRGNIFVHISGSIRPITLIWASLERSFPPAEVEYSLVKGDDVRSGNVENSKAITLD